VLGFASAGIESGFPSRIAMLNQPSPAIVDQDLGSVALIAINWLNCTELLKIVKRWEPELRSNEHPRGKSLPPLVASHARMNREGIDLPFQNHLLEEPINVVSLGPGQFQTRSVPDLVSSTQPVLPPERFWQQAQQDRKTTAGKTEISAQKQHSPRWSAGIHPVRARLSPFRPFYATTSWSPIAGASQFAAPVCRQGIVGNHRPKGSLSFGGKAELGEI
jgi:hypothetical protein